MMLARVVVVILVTITTVHAVVNRCEHADLRRTIDAINLNAQSFDKMIRLMQKEYAPNIELRKKVPYWKIDDAYETCVEPTADVKRWLQSVSAVLQLMPLQNSARVPFERSMQEFTRVLDHLELILAPAAMVTNFWITDDRERELLKRRATFPVVNQCAPIGLVGRIGIGNRIPVVDVGFMELRIFQVWPSESLNELELRIRYERTSTHMAGTIPACASRYLENTDRNATWSNYGPHNAWRMQFYRSISKFKHDLKIAMSLLGLSGYAQIREYCVDGDRLGILYQSPSPSAVSLTQLIDYRRESSNCTLFTKRWQRVWSVRVRQSLELLDTLGWVHLNLTSDTLYFDLRTGHVTIQDLRGVHKKQELPEALRKKEQFMVALQITQLTQTTPWESLFGYGAHDLYRHIDVQSLGQVL